MALGIFIADLQPSMQYVLIVTLLCQVIRNYLFFVDGVFSCHCRFNPFGIHHIYYLESSYDFFFFGNHVIGAKYHRQSR